MPDIVFDLLLAAGLIWIALRALFSPDLFKGVVLFITFGLLMALAWVRLGAPDIALAEAAIGAGLTGALLLDAVGQIGQHDAPTRPVRWSTGGIIALVALVAAGLAIAALHLPAVPAGLAPAVADALPHAGVAQPVTAVLLNFRGYDTWLELGVLLLAVLALLALRRAADFRDVPEYTPDPLLAALAAAIVPMMLLAAGYLLWLGTYGSGGAFQAGAMLGGAGVLLRLSGYRSIDAIGARLLRAALASGFTAFLLTAVVLLASGRNLLAYPREQAYAVILLLESAAALGIGCTLTALFSGAVPRESRR